MARRSLTLEERGHCVYWSGQSLLRVEKKSNIIKMGGESQRCERVRVRARERERERERERVGEREVGRENLKREGAQIMEENKVATGVTVL